MFSLHLHTNCVEADTSSAPDDGGDPKRMRIMRALENLWRRLIRKKKPSQGGCEHEMMGACWTIYHAPRAKSSPPGVQANSFIAVDNASTHTPIVSPDVAMEKVMSQINLLVHEIRNIKHAQQADRALALGGAASDDAGPGAIAQKLTAAPEIKTSEIVRSSRFNDLTLCKRSDGKTGNSCQIQPTHEPDAHFLQSSTSANIHISASIIAESSLESHSASTVIKSAPWPEPVFNNLSRQQLLKRIEKFRFTHLIDPGFIKQLSDPYARVDMVCNNLLDIRCDMERLWSISCEVTTGAASVAVLRILEPWKRVGKEATATICDNLRHDIQLYWEWLHLVSGVGEGSEASMGQSWWADYDKKLEEIEELNTEELLAQIDVVRDCYLVTKEKCQDQTNAKKLLGATSLTREELSSSTVFPLEDIFEFLSYSQGRYECSNVERSLDLG
ncbi:hypothetical protein J1614_004819 [Plenodomus biglobosus]|nr:hypothetical protein J1614_004819 [Plenodomus biglobosus]